MMQNPTFTERINKVQAELCELLTAVENLEIDKLRKTKITVELYKMLSINLEIRDQIPS